MKNIEGIKIGSTVYIRTKRGKIHHGEITFQRGGPIIIQPKDKPGVALLESNIVKNIKYYIFIKELGE